VQLATEKATGKKYAIKILEKAHVVKEKKVKYVNLEKNVFEKLNSHPSFVKLYYTFHDARRLYYVLSYAENGELLHYIRKLGSFDQKCAQHYTAEMVLALEYMHSQGIIHRDFKPENILLGADMHLQITDFGTAKILLQPQPPADSRSNAGRDSSGSTLSVTSATSDTLSEEGARKYEPKVIVAPTAEVDAINRRSSFVGTAEYVSPELLKNKQTSMASDLWALGCIVYQIIAGRPPFKGVTEYQTFNLVSNACFDFPQHFPIAARRLIKELLVIDPHQRLGCPEMGGYAELKKDPFFDGVEWDKVLTMQPPELRPYLPAAGDGVEMTSNMNVGPDGHIAHTSVILPLDPCECGDLRNDIIDEEISLKERRCSNRSERSDDLANLVNAQLNIGDVIPATPLPAEEDFSEWNYLLQPGEKIILCGAVKKRRGLFYVSRVGILTDAPRIMFIGLNDKKLKGEIDWKKNGDWRPELKNNKTFFLHTPRHTYYIDDMNSRASAWVHRINEQAQLKR
ncbi:AGC/PDK1 protein kinase, partial [Sphaeroforma arctica JP610]